MDGCKGISEVLQECGDSLQGTPVESYFKEGVCDGAFLTQEYTYDAHILRDYLLEQLRDYPQVKICYEMKDRGNSQRE